MQHFPSSGPATNSGHGSSSAPGCHPPHTGTLGAGAHGADQCHATANQQHPLRDLWPCSGGAWAQGAKPPRKWGPPAALALLLSGRGWLGKSTPTLAGAIPVQERRQRQIPLLAPLFRQSVGQGRWEPGHDQVSDWKRCDRSKAVKCSCACEGDRPPSSCNTDCRASATAAGISLAFLGQRAGHSGG